MKAFAKINVGLKIINKRDDGFHNIETIFYPLNLFDELLIQAVPNKKKCVSVKILSDKIHIPTDRSNSCYKIIETFYKNFKIKDYYLFKIRIIKNIPVGSGLGGGSSDAASVLKFLIKFFKIDISENKEKIIETASGVGSDIPFFLISKPCFAKGRGELLKALPDFTIPYDIILINPNIYISTKWAYERIDHAVNENNISELSSVNTFDLLKSKIFFNDFERTVFNQYKVLENIKRELFKKGALFASLSGSGATIYAFFKSESNKYIHKLAQTYRKKGYFVFIN